MSEQKYKGYKKILQANVFHRSMTKGNVTLIALSRQVVTLELSYSLNRLRTNWLQVLGPAELAQMDQRVCQQLHPIMPPLDMFKS
jgi:hypothetical protein